MKKIILLVIIIIIYSCDSKENIKSSKEKTIINENEIQLLNIFRNTTTNTTTIKIHSFKSQNIYIQISDKDVINNLIKNISINKSESKNRHRCYCRMCNGSIFFKFYNNKKLILKISLSHSNWIRFKEGWILKNNKWKWTEGWHILIKESENYIKKFLINYGFDERLIDS